MTLNSCTGQASRPGNPKALIVPMRLLAFTSMLLLAEYSLAQTVGNWTLNNTVAGTGSAFSTASNITAGPAVGSTAFNAGSEWFGQNGFPSGATPNLNAYLQFAVSPNTGFELNIASLVLRMRRSNTGSPAGSGPTSWCLRSSMDGYTNNLASGTMTHNYSNYTVLLTGFNQLSAGVTFRLYGYGVTVSSGGNNRLVLDNITVSGTLFVLPLVLKAPSATADERGNVELSWKAYDISAGTVFRLQRSLNGTSFETIHTFAETNDQPTKSYEYIDRSIPPTAALVYYRVQAVEPDGNEYFSPVTVVSRKGKASLLIENTVARGSLLQVTVHIPTKGNYTIAVYNASGVLLQKQVMGLEPGVQRLQIPIHKLAGGIGVLNIYDKNGKVSQPFAYYQ